MTETMIRSGLHLGGQMVGTENWALLVAGHTANFNDYVGGQAAREQWEDRLDELSTLGRPELRDQVADRARWVLEYLSSVGFDTGPLRIFLTEEGSVELRGRNGALRVTLEIAPDGSLTVHRVDVGARTSETFAAPTTRVAASVLAKLL